MRSDDADSLQRGGRFGGKCGEPQCRYDCRRALYCVQLRGDKPDRKRAARAASLFAGHLRGNGRGMRAGDDAGINGRGRKTGGDRGNSAFGERVWALCGVSGGNREPSRERGAEQRIAAVFVRDTCLATANCTPQSTRISLQPGDVPPGTVNAAGPALAGSAKQVALPDGKSATLFTATVAVDDRVLLAIPGAGK